MGPLPCQRLGLLSDRSTLVLAQAHSLLSFHLPSSALHRSPPHLSPHRAIIASLTTTPSNLVIATFTDRLLLVSLLPHFRFSTSRLLPKPPTSTALSPHHSSLLVADKSGDVYHIPLDDPSCQPTSQPHPPSPEKNLTSNPPPQPIHLSPIAGHVSLLTALTLVPLHPTPWLITADRDEHIRISRYPHAWSIVGFLLGHRKFVAALLWLGILPDRPSGILLSAGGDEELFVWDLASLQCLDKIPIGSRLADGVKVCPPQASWFAKNSKSHKKRKRVNDCSPQNTQDHQSSSETTHVPNPLSDLASKPLRQCCINKIIQTSSLESASRFVVVSSVGSSTLACIPLPLLLNSKARDGENEVKYFDFEAPVLDMIDISGKFGQILVSLDPAFLHSSHPSQDTIRGIRVIDFGSGEPLESSETFFDLFKLNEELFGSSTSNRLGSGCTEVCGKEGNEEDVEIEVPPSQAVLYPELELFTKQSHLCSPGKTLVGQNEDEDEVVAGGDGDGGAVGDRFQKEKGGRNGKKALGRARARARVATATKEAVDVNGSVTETIGNSTS